MPAFDKAVALGLIGLVGFATVDAAAARTRHHYRHARVVERVPHRFVFASPEVAAYPNFAGRFSGAFETGILGASTADPYDRPSYGYGADGQRGPGFSYYGF